MAFIVVFSTKGFPSSPHLVDRKKSGVAKKISNEASASRLAALPVTTNKTVFFLPGVDIKVCLLLLFLLIVICALTLMVGHQEEHPTYKTFEVLAWW